ncbi:alcohol dehydrogenase catalytic domain-containing protein [Chryseobacterium sp. T20]|uniref:alcohol dehydrogenase catalytic domain-containing protein n=1 Tax=Chryseobacterium sp. T20 TaxID=3395375 RepID=UPI0039BCC5D6
MKAIVVKENSNWKELQLEEVSIPEIKPNQVLVKIKAIGVNPIDWKAPEYNLFDFLQMKTPYIMGSDICGIIEKVGEEVKGFKNRR